ncbi:MAG: RNA polymerase-associated protein RapA [Haemophilus parainfluenzae]|uniref:RNA polymerase-associated protein RapA n=1 Tax=Haemophilus parainfluenzae TaxID=729 RepID=A0AAQ0KCQ1_HAEPA|nr:MULTISPECIES: RNA polymerase-associated protein RapA [Haemophilus]MBS5085633.1 RNA polymerase-associated protein RapA [Haemophilus parainfluenzae]MBS6871498.1 RNA polymerase-associated protein RapA [Haemophilus parainfluenzae]MBS7064265.1 RNA polymerase-associated protein RapA [Haemophilus parainfluenzae]MDU3503012.1 RNA polymerase-associated protein RapA [Haemophilus parainfluenzae]OFO65820.1 RNA polymerase-associated protein RapA [Haemophilus sp. HMSC068C11]
MSFAIGQRWISETENSLGLGMITDLDFRSVTLHFPATDETRIYAVAQAPLTRIVLNKGEQLHHQAGWQGEVLDVQEMNGLLFYLVKNAQGEDVIVNEKELSPIISFSQAKDRLFSSQIDRSEHFALRYQTLLHQQAQFQSPLRGLRGNRAGLIPHQLHIAQEVGNRVNPRVLLADEVGLGKTIEAGMILQNQLFTEKVQRVLIIVPETLQHQWLVEMLRRFNLHFSLFDEERCEDFAEQAINPFSTESLIICALDWLKAHPNRVQQAIEAEFDCLIVDEAHHLAWSENAPSAAYLLVEQLANAIPSVLLLTATPEQLGLESHFARLRLLDHERFYDYQAFLKEQENYQPVADAVQSLLSEKPLSAVEKNHISDLLNEQDVESLFKALACHNDEEKQAARQELIQNLIDRHGTSRILFRNTRQGVKGFPHRVYHQVTIDATEGDEKIHWLIDFLKSHRNEKILVICKTAQTAIQLEQILREKEAIRIAVFHERMSIIERDRAAAYFADTDNGAQVLLSSSIGSEGRNFQFACHLVLFDLPENPDLLEQCIGRLDRIGQTRDVQIYVPCLSGSAQQDLARWYHEGLNAFEQTCPIGMALFEQYETLLKVRSENKADFEQLILQTQKQAKALRLALEKGRDRLLELNSNGGEKAQRLAGEIAQTDNSPQLVNFALNLFDIIGVEQDDLGENSIVITPTGTMLVPDFPGLKEEGVTVTFDRQLALAREELEFLTWDHPMIRQGIDLIASGDIGKAAMALLVNKQLPAGTLLVELIYMIESQSPKGLQLNRFLPPTPVRLLLDSKGNDLAGQVNFDTLQNKLKLLSKDIANKMVKMARPNIEQLIKLGEHKITEIAQAQIREASRLADQTLSTELNRLIALKAVNKNIRQVEIDVLEKQRLVSLEELSKASWRLDSLRVIVTNKE